MCVSCFAYLRMHAHAQTFRWMALYSRIFISLLIKYIYLYVENVKTNLFAEKRWRKSERGIAKHRNASQCTMQIGESITWKKNACICARLALLHSTSDAACMHRNRRDRSLVDRSEQLHCHLIYYIELIIAFVSFNQNSQRHLSFST